MITLRNQAEANFLRLLLLIEQDWTCPITGYALTTKNSVLDHDHTTGHVRGVLFNGANRALQDHRWVGYGLRKKDHAGILRKMADYLEKDHTEVIYHTCRKPNRIVKKSNYKKLGFIIMKSKGKLPAWWGYVERRGKRGQKLSGRLKALYKKYDLEPEYY